MAEQAAGDLPELLTVREVAAYLKLHEVTVLNFARQGKLPGFKVGRAWRFPRRISGRGWRGSARRRRPMRSGFAPFGESFASARRPGDIAQRMFRA